MKRRSRIVFTSAQRAEIWDRWQRGESMSSIGRGFDRDSSSIYPMLSRAGGIRPLVRKRSRLALTLLEREVISRGLAACRSLRSSPVARVAPTICRSYCLPGTGGKELDDGNRGAAGSAGVALPLRW